MVSEESYKICRWHKKVTKTLRKAQPDIFKTHLQT